ncbi:hypothetical protein [Sphingobacterium prati]|uniref:hypothetical protein n=1 Tax=Sphingobacterium prati TaxID=2737006 RepID=UPI001554749C|nr:hypothetical protein [Sphingobacterium prati]NPE49173.1 hypothetical protein [Sphingobacterium prati]
MKSLRTAKENIKLLGLRIGSVFQSLWMRLSGRFVLRFRYRVILWFREFCYAPICLSLALKRVVDKMWYPRKFALFPGTLASRFQGSWPVTT